MAYKWVIKRYKEDPVKVSENVGRQALAAWEAGTGVIKLPNGINMSSSSISAIEPTHELQDDKDIYALTAGDFKRELVLDMQGDVVTDWFKRECGETAWEKHYAALPHYHKIVDNDKTVWVAMRLPLFTNDTQRAQELVPCEEHEVKRLEEINAR